MQGKVFEKYCYFGDKIKYNIQYVLKHLVLLAAILVMAGCTSVPPVSTLPEQYDVAKGAAIDTLHTSDNLTLFGQWWEPAAPIKAKAVVVLVHGTFVHSGFYSRWAEYLAQNNYAVYALDLRGWGQSQGFGRRAYVENFAQYSDDLVLAYTEAKKKYPDVPLFLQGESLGGLVVLYSQAQHQIKADGLVLNAPAVKPAASLGFIHTPHWMASAQLWVASLPGEAFPNMPTLVPGRVVEMFSGLAVDSGELVTEFINDPHVVHTALPLGFITALKDGTNKVQDNLANVTAPTIIVQGTKDNLVPVSSSEFTRDNIASTDKTLKVYQGLTHATLHDTGHEAVWADLLQWLDQRSQQRKNEVVFNNGVQ